MVPAMCNSSFGNWTYFRKSSHEYVFLNYSVCNLRNCDQCVFCGSDVETGKLSILSETAVGNAEQ